MKLSCLRPLGALLLTLGLAACGGKASYDVSGTIIGLNNDGLILANGSDIVKPAAGTTRFTFPTRIDYGTNYNITFQKQPAHMTCSINGGSGSAGHYVSIEAVVTCGQNAYSVGGSISGLTAENLVLINGNVQTPVAKDSKTFVMNGTVIDGGNYGISVFTQPTGLVCNVVPGTGTGTMGEANVTTVQVVCNPANPS